MRQFKSKQDQFNAGVRVAYKKLRRKGHLAGPETFTLAQENAARLFAAFAIMEASDYRICPIRLATSI